MAGLLNVLITGANRGIGLALTRAYLSRENVRVIATSRRPEASHSLSKLAQSVGDRVRIEQLDVNDDRSIDRIGRMLDDQQLELDRLILNAGVYYKGEARANGLGRLERGPVTETVVTNAVSPLFVLQASLPALRRADGAKVICLSSVMGSLASAMGGEVNAYSVSKAALNMVAVGAAAELRRDRIAVLAVHPGWVSTEMGGSAAPVDPADSAAGIVALVERAGISESGRYFDFRGRELPW